ncbi:Pseudo-hevein [Madurella mycetomatis]|uniref:Pseudo-hevein n=1 Tax=Madurella mycetomatis TaxID=100816 RepID=A0A175W9N2_9PEZI|nr:Pseudo-hevein [Madurella mycetomatis]
MKPTYIGLVATLWWAGAFGASPAMEEGIAERAMLAGRRLSSRISNRHRNGTANFAELGLRQDAGQCGPQAGRCPDNQCCSDYGFCGESIDHCHPLFDCQEQYGSCGWPRPAPEPSTSTTPTPTSTSTSTTPVTPTTTSTTSAQQPPTSTSTSMTPIPTGDLEVTTNGMCGNGTMCVGNPNFGPCCSQFFWCGSSLDYCGAGCRSDFGACLGVPGIPGGPAPNITTTTTTTSQGQGPITSSTTTTPTTTRVTTTTSTTPSTPTVSIPAGMTSSTDGRCGNSVTCLGSQFGRCCSQFGFCGDGDQYCPYIVGCQPEFGYCDPQ